MRAPLTLALAAALVDLSPLKLAVERVGTLSYVHCRDRQAEGCPEFEKLEVRPELDWASLVAAGKKAKPAGKKSPVLATVRGVDQYGGLWVAALLPAGRGTVSEFSAPFAYAVFPDFKGYAVDEKGSVEPLKKTAFEEARAAQPQPKKGLRRLLE